MDMSNHNRRSGHRTAVAAVAASLVLLVTACSSDSSKSADDATTTVASTIESTSTAASTSVPESTSTSATLAPAKATTTTGPKATLADPPMPSSTMPPISIYNPGLLLVPTVKTLTAQTNFTCVQAAQAQFKTTVTWTTTYADHVSLNRSGGGSANWDQAHYPANGNVVVPLACGETTYLKVKAYSATDVAGTFKIIAISVSSS